MGLVTLILAVLLAATSVSLVWVVILCRQAIRDRDRLLDERGARLVDLWRDLEEKETRIATLERGNERLTQLAVAATEGWRDEVVAGRARVP